MRLRLAIRSELESGCLKFIAIVSFSTVVFPAQYAALITLPKSDDAQECSGLFFIRFCS